MRDNRPRQPQAGGISNRAPQGRDTPSRPSPATQAAPDPVLARIIVEGDAEALVKRAEELGRGLAQPLSTSQIRSLFTEVRQIEAQWRHSPERASRRLTLLKPKMAYRARKETGQGVQALVDVLTPCVDLVQGDAARFTRFVEFFEAILAYHKAYGGR